MKSYGTKMRRYLVYTALIICCFLLQSSLFSYFALANVVPNLLIILTVSIAIIRGSTQGMVIGFFCGLLMDTFYGSYFGMYALGFLLIGYILGIFNRIFYKEDITFPLLLIAAGDFMYGLYMCICRFLPSGDYDFWFCFRRIMIPEMIYTTLVSIFLYRLFLFICTKVEDKGSENFIV